MTLIVYQPAARTAERACFREAFGSQCGICGDADDSASVDHNHTTGLVRGTLCSKCNIKLGHFDKYLKWVGENLDWCRKAAAFLECSNEEAFSTAERLIAEYRKSERDREIQELVDIIKQRDKAVTALSKLNVRVAQRQARIERTYGRVVI